MAGLTHFRAADGLNDTPDSQATPHPVALMPFSAVYAPASAAITAAGTGFVPADTIVVHGSGTIRDTTLTVTHTKVITAAVVAGGTGGTPGAVTITGTTGTGTKFQATGTITAGGVLSGALVVTVAGDYTVNPSSIAVEPVTGGSLSGCTVILTMGVLTATVTTPGVVNAASVSVSEVSSSGSGTGAAFTLTATEMATQASRSTTGTTSQVAASATAVTVLAANPARAGATIVNDSAAVLYLILSSTTPTSAVYTIALDVKGTVGSYYEVPFGYTGIIKGIWASATGNAVVTEIS